MSRVKPQMQHIEEIIFADKLRYGHRWSGNLIMGGSSCVLGMVGKNVTIGKNAYVGPNVIVNDNAIISDNVVLFGKAHVPYGCVIDPGIVLGEPLDLDTTRVESGGSAPSEWYWFQGEEKALRIGNFVTWFTPEALFANSEWMSSRPLTIQNAVRWYDSITKIIALENSIIEAFVLENSIIEPREPSIDELPVSTISVTCGSFQPVYVTLLSPQDGFIREPIIEAAKIFSWYGWLQCCLNFPSSIFEYFVRPRMEVTNG